MTIGKNRRSSQNRREIIWTIGIRCVVCSLITLMTLQAPIAEGQQNPSQQQQAPVRTQAPAPTQEQALSAPPMMPADTPANADQNSLPSAPVPQSGLRTTRARAAAGDAAATGGHGRRPI